MEEHPTALHHWVQKADSQEGMAFIAILMILTVLTTLGLSFLFTTGRLTTAVAARQDGIQAQYLAETAANHAMWRLLNEPGFPESETVYYMHDLAGGRYGYKIIKPTPTSYAGVATVGSSGGSVAKQSYVQSIRPSNIMTAYDKLGAAIPKQRQLVGASLSDSVDTVNDGPGTAKWLVLKGCPLKKEIVMGTLDGDDDINLAVWDGSSWDHQLEFTQTAYNFHRGFDIAYENLSGNALVVGNYDNTPAIRYTVWNGTGWSPNPPQVAFNLPNPELNYLTMASKPNSNEILIVAYDSSNDLKIVQWNGVAFTDLGVVDTDMGYAGSMGAVIVYEQQSGVALVIWGHKNSNQLYYCMWDGVALSSAGLLPDFGARPRVIRAAADPTGDHILLAAVDAKSDINVAVWDGSTWSDSREIETDADDPAQQILDVAWEDTGEQAMVAWSPYSGFKVRYFTWQKGTALADHAVETGPDVQTWPYIIRLMAISGTEKIILLTDNYASELRYSFWAGNAFSGDPAVMLETSLPIGIPFDIAEFKVP